MLLLLLLLLVRSRIGDPTIVSTADIVVPTGERGIMFAARSSLDGERQGKSLMVSFLMLTRHWRVVACWVFGEGVFEEDGGIGKNSDQESFYHSRYKPIITTHLWMERDLILLETNLIHFPSTGYG